MAPAYGETQVLAGGPPLSPPRPHVPPRGGADRDDGGGGGGVLAGELLYVAGAVRDLCSRSLVPHQALRQVQGPHSPPFPSLLFILRNSSFVFELLDFRSKVEIFYCFSFSNPSIFGLKLRFLFPFL